ncbi:MAG: aminotransferase class V-fold PLP-dependent enzyme, partial [Clostridia bacterium]|nr:aminotransferase class V-fold PLP-dependent enzyme [Clostridia bacterium]
EIPSQELARRLASEGICVRAGYHCAPLAHKAIGSIAHGAVRLSFSVFNTTAELDTLWKALKR